jgi:DNA-binding PadR family transcriptional regulator
MFGQGDLRLVLLALIAEAPRHGYELIKAIEEKFGGAYAPSPGAIYPTLTLLEEQDQIRATAHDGTKKRFEITEAGRAVVQESQATIDGIFARIALVKRSLADRTAPESVRQAMHTLRHALMLRPGAWSEAETGRILAILQRAAREIAEG